MRIALFVTCIGDTLFPEAGRATVAVLERLGHEVVFPAGADLLRPDAREQRLPRARRARSRGGSSTMFGEYEVVVVAVVVVRRDGARAVSGARAERRRRLARGRACFELSELLVDRLGVEDVGASFPHRVDLPPDLPLAARDARRRRAAAAAAQRARASSSSSCRDADECCGFGGTFAVKNADTSTAMLADKCARDRGDRREVCTAVDGSCLLQIGGGLVARAAPPCAPVHLAEILAGRRTVSATRSRAAARAALAERAAAREPAQRDRRRSATKRAGVVAELPDWEELREAGRAIKADVLAHLDEYLVQFEAAVTAAGGQVHWARDAAEANAIVARGRPRARRRPRS